MAGTFDGIRSIKCEVLNRVDSWPAMVAGFLIGKVDMSALQVERAGILRLYDAIIKSGDKDGLVTPRAAWSGPREAFETATAWVLKRQGNSIQPGVFKKPIKKGEP